MSAGAADQFLTLRGVDGDEEVEGDGLKEVADVGNDIAVAASEAKLDEDGPHAGDGEDQRASPAPPRHSLHPLKRSNTKTMITVGIVASDDSSTSGTEDD